MFWSAVPTTTTRRMAVRGAPRARAMAATSMQSTKIETGMPGKSRCRASPTSVDEKMTGKIGPPRYPLLNESASRRTFRSAMKRSIPTPNRAGSARIPWICPSPEKSSSGMK